MAVRRMRQSTFESIFNLVYWALSINVLLTVACLPILAVLVTVSQPWTVWPLVVLALAFCGPAMTAAFSCFDRYQRDSDMAVWSDFVRGYRATFWRGLGIWTSAEAIIAIIVVDVLFLAQFSFSLVILPLLAILAVVVALLTPTALALAVMRPDASALACVKAAFACSLRCLWVAVLDLVFMVVLGVVVVIKPPVGMVIAPSIVLFLVWVNAQYVTRRAVGPRPGLRTMIVGRQER